MSRTKPRPYLFGRLIWLTGACRIYHDGDGYSAVFRPWHPAYWILLVIFTPVCAIIGEPLFDVFPTKIGKFFVEHPEKLEFVNPWRI